MFRFYQKSYDGMGQKMISPGSQEVQEILVLLSLQQVPKMIDTNTFDQSNIKVCLLAIKVSQNMLLYGILTAGPLGPAGPVSPSFPDRP